MNLLKRGTLRYERQFHDDTGTLADPTTSFAELRKPDGTWVALAAPTKQNAKTGLYGGSLDMSSAVTYPAGPYALRIGGSVPTDKTVATVTEFYLSEYSWDDIIAALSEALTAPRLAKLDRDIAEKADVAVTVPEPVFAGEVVIDPPVALTTEEHDHLMTLAVQPDASTLATVVPATLDTSGTALGVFPLPNIRIEAWVVLGGGTFAYRRSCVTDGDGGFSIQLEKGATYQLRPVVAGSTVTPKEVAV